MKYSDTESLNKLEEQIYGFEALLKVAKFIPFLFGGSKKVKYLANQVKELKEKIIEMKKIPDEFNLFFSGYGWIAYDAMDTDFMQTQIDLAKNGNLADAIAGFSNYYNNERIKFEIQLLNRIEITSIRLPLIKSAFMDYEENKFYAMIPIILMMIDGIVNDVVGKGFHSENKDMDAWDSITTIDNGLEVIQSVFRKGRFKTRIDEIEEPYRNGILHGLDLGYANKKVALKCWHYLFVIRDWAQAKLSEKERHSKFIADNIPPDFMDILLRIKKNNLVKEELEKWKAKQYSVEDIQFINANPSKIEKDEPEYVVLQFFRYLEKRNYKALSELFWKRYFYSGQAKIPSIKQEYSNMAYKVFHFTKIVNEAPAITEVYVDTDSNSLTFRLIYESKTDDVAIPSFNNGFWKIVGIQKKI